MSDPDWTDNPVVAAALSLSPARWIQLAFLVNAFITVGVAILPERPRAYLLTYGARGDKTAETQDERSTEPQETDGGRYTDNPEQESGEEGEEDDDQGSESHADPTQPQPEGTGAPPAQESRQDDWFTKLVAWATSWGQIPHSWFGGFYVVSLACSVFWLEQYLTDGRVLRFLVSRQAAASPEEPGMEPGQVVLVWSMMFLQAVRRALESLLIFKSSSKSTMWIVHWALGHVFYIVTSAAVWIEGSGAIYQHRLLSDFTGLVSPKTIAGTVLYIVAAVGQFQCHKHLGELKKYSLPSRGAFRILVCPHYSFECLLYFSMALAGAPEGALLNTTLLCTLLFVVANLSITAGTTAAWYRDKFGADAVKKRWRIIPLLY